MSSASHSGHVAGWALTHRALRPQTQPAPRHEGQAFGKGVVGRGGKTINQYYIYVGLLLERCDGARGGRRDGG